MVRAIDLSVKKFSAQTGMPDLEDVAIFIGKVVSQQMI